MKGNIVVVYVLLMLGIAGSATVQAAYTLENNISLDNLSASSGQQLRHMVNVPAGAGPVTIAISGGNGDADLYVSYRSVPTTVRFNCRPYSAGNRESCLSNRAGTYYIMIRAYRAFSGLSLKASYATPRSQPSAPPTQQTPVIQPAPVANASCLSAVQQQLLDAHNTARTQARNCGTTFHAAVPALEWSCALGQAATAHSSDMANVNFFSHTGSNGSSAGQRISSTGYTWRAWGENIAAGHPSVGSVMQGWLNSPGHCRNIMSPSVTQLGSALITLPGSDYSRYWTAVFARPQ